MIIHVASSETNIYHDLPSLKHHDECFYVLLRILLRSSVLPNKFRFLTQ